MACAAITQRGWPWRNSKGKGAALLRPRCMGDAPRRPAVRRPDDYSRRTTGTNARHGSIVTPGALRVISPSAVPMITSLDRM